MAIARTTRSETSRSSHPARADGVAVCVWRWASRLIFAGLLTNASISVLGRYLYLAERWAGFARCCRMSTTMSSGRRVKPRPAS